jgi:hypothetical protein
MLLGMRPALDPAVRLDCIGDRDNQFQSFRPGVLLRQYHERHVVEPHELEQHYSRFVRASFGSGYRDQVIGADTLAVLVGTALDVEWKSFHGAADHQKRVCSLDQEQTIAKRPVHAASTLSDWQLGQTGRLPTPLNFSPQDLHL